MKITSRDNQKLKNARKTRDGKVAELIFVEGLRLGEECLRSNVQIVEAFYIDGFPKKGRGSDLLNLLLERNIEVFEVPEQIFNSVAATKTSQGIILIAKRPKTERSSIETGLASNKTRFPLFILLHEVNNPNNLGGILRTAEAAGVAGIILTNGSAYPFSPKALRASMGAAFRLPIWDNADFSEVLEWASANDLNSLYADPRSKNSYFNIDWRKARLLVFGSEAHGLAASEIEQIGETCLIPMDNNVESLNLSVSCGIILFEAKRRIAK